MINIKKLFIEHFCQDKGQQDGGENNMAANSIVIIH